MRKQTSCIPIETAEELHNIISDKKYQNSDCFKTKVVEFESFLTTYRVRKMISQNERAST